MWFSERYTFSRGRSEVPRIFLRIRSCTCRRFVFFDVRVSIKMSLVVRRRSLVASKPKTYSNFYCALANDERPTTQRPNLLRSGLAYLLLQTLAGVTHPFVLVRIGWTQAAHFCCNLSDFLAIDSGDAQLGLLRI